MWVCVWAIAIPLENWLSVDFCADLTSNLYADYRIWMAMSWNFTLVHLLCVRLSIGMKSPLVLWWQTVFFIESIATHKQQRVFVFGISFIAKLENRTALGHGITFNYLVVVFFFKSLSPFVSFRHQMFVSNGLNLIWFTWFNRYNCFQKLFFYRMHVNKI